MRTSTFRHLLLPLLLLTATQAFATDDAAERRLQSIVEARNKTAEEAKAIVAALDPRDRAALIEQQDIVDRLSTANAESEIGLSDEDNQALDGANRAIDGILARAPRQEEDEMVCRRERKVGTNFATRVCKPRSQIEAERERSQREVEDSRSRR